ncbi:MAG: hypothetical protein Q4A28_06565 [Brachymonas sp.]|nr:hypothetical protein [Brachymonas sp.]
MGAAMIFTHGWVNKRIFEFEVLSLQASSSVDGFGEAYEWLLKVPNMAGALYQGNRGF